MSASTDNGIQHRRQEVQQAVKNACDQLNADGVTPRDYVEQLAWLFFLKAFDEAENQREEEAEFGDEVYRRRLNGEYRWTSWASRTDRPDEMLRFVDGELWPHLCNFGSRDGTGEFDADPVGEQFRRIFSSVRNHSRRGASFARVVQQVDRLHFSDRTDVIVLSELYEDLLKRVAADSPGYAGEFYTQRHIIRAMVEVVRPRVGERIYDPCFGTGGFLAEAGEYVRRTAGTLSGADLERLKQESFFGIELKPLTYLLGVMNLILHGIESANLELGNTLERHSANVSAKHRYHVILSNPPYGGKLVRELQTNFTIRSGATEILFLQHIMANLATGGRAAVIIPEGVLFRGGLDAKVRERLLREFDVHTILSLPAGCFLPYTGVKTNVLFFDRREGGKGTEAVWYYEMTNDGFELKQTRRPIKGSQIPDFLAKWEGRVTGENSWVVPVEEVAGKGFDLSARNPNRGDDFEHKPALELVQSIRAKEERVIELLGELEEILEGDTLRTVGDWQALPISEVAAVNPRRDALLRSMDDRLVATFVPMAAVDEVSGTIAKPEVKTLGELRKGFTPFVENDVIFAKITPCMENGKSAVANGLVNGLGFGSTEFHVVRSGPRVLPEWLWFFLRQRSVREEARRNFRGSAGQQRVPADFLRQLVVPVPPIDVQRRTVHRIRECMERVDEIRRFRDIEIRESKAIESAVFHDFLYDGKGML